MKLQPKQTNNELLISHKFAQLIWRGTAAATERKSDFPQQKPGGLRHSEWGLFQKKWYRRKKKKKNLKKLSVWFGIAGARLVFWL